MHIQKYLSFTAAMFFLATIANAQLSWTQLGTPDGGAVLCLHQRGDTLYAGTRGGIYQSLDSGTTWQQTTLKSPVVYAIASNACGLVAAATQQGAYVSTDGGDTWSATPLDYPMYSVAVGQKGDVFVGSGGWDQLAEVYRSTDSGATWSGQIVSLDLMDAWIKSLFVAEDGTLLAGSQRLSVTASDYMFRSTNNGWTWIEPEGSGNFYSGFTQNAKGELFAGSWDGKLLRSTDIGNSWATIELGDFTGWVSAITTMKDGSMLLSTSILYRSTDSSLATWTVADSVGFESMLAPFPGKVLGGSSGGNTPIGWPIGTSAGLYQSDETGSPWRKSMNGICAEEARGVDVDTADRLWVQGLVSMDHGRKWKTMFTQEEVSCFFADPTGWLFESNGMNRNLYRSPDGSSWERITGNPVLDNVWRMRRAGNWLLSGGQFGLARSSDNGASWETVSQLWTTDVVQAKDGILLSSTSYSGVYRSDSSWKNWEKSSQGLPIDSSGNTPTSALAMAADGTLYCGLQASGLYRSTDGGRSWKLILEDSARITNILIFEPETIVLATYSHGILFSSDKGAHWTEVNDGLTNPRVLALAVDKTGFLYAGTDGSGAFRSSKSIYPCTAKLRVMSNAGLSARSGDTIAIPLRFNPSLNPHDDLTLSATLRYDEKRFSFVGITADSMRGLSAVVKSSSGGALRFTVEGLLQQKTDTIAYLLFAVHGIVEKDVGAIFVFDSVLAWTQCETIITAENIKLDLLAHPSSWSITLTPNPSSSQLNISISAPFAREVHLTMTDVLGRRVAQLFSGSLSEGTHTLSFNIDGFSSGNYWVWLTAAGVHQQKRLVIMK